MSGAIHNNGYAKAAGSQYKCIGNFSNLERHLLKLKDKERLYGASDKHQTKKKENRF